MLLSVSVDSSPADHRLSASKPPVQADVISLRLLKGISGSSSGKRSMKYSPTIHLHESDAGMIDVVVGDRVFIISTTDYLPQQIKAVTIARVKSVHANSDRSNTPRSSLFSGTGSGKSNNHKKNKLTVGNCHLFPVSLAESFLFSGACRYAASASRVEPTNPRKAPTARLALAA